VHEQEKIKEFFRPIPYVKIDNSITPINDEIKSQD
jgi:hypothetical protein